MAAYEYLCRDCDHEFTVFLAPSELESKHRIRCPHCESDNVMPKPTSLNQDAQEVITAGS